MHQVEPEIPHRQEVRPSLDAIGDRARAIEFGALEHAAADRLLQSILGTSGDKLSADLELDEWEVANVGEREPLRPGIIDGDGNLVEAKLSCGPHCQVEVGYELGAVDLDDKPLKGGVVRKLLAQSPNCLGIGQNGRW